MDETALLALLTEEIKTIKAILDEAKAVGQTFNEAQTEFIVIDPLLKRLGYGPLEISKQGHDSIAKNFPDYALLAGKPQKWFLEAKKLDLNLQDGEAAQAVNYANNQGAEWAALTNGRKWYIYNAHLPKPLPEKRVMQIDDLFAEEDAAQKLMLLSKPSMLNNSLQEAWIFQELSRLIDTQFKTPNSEIRRVIRKLGNDLIKSNIDDEVVGKVLLFATSSILAPSSQSPAATIKLDSNAKANLSKAPVIGIQTTDEAEIRYYTFDEIARDLALATYRKPKVIAFSDGHLENVKFWADVAYLAVKHIGQSFVLPELPFSSGGKGKTFFLNSTPTHENGKTMANYRIVTVQSQEIYINTNQSALNISASLLALFKVAHVPLSEIQVSIE